MAATIVSPTAKLYAQTIKKIRFGIFGFWLVVVILGLKFGLRFMDETISTYDSPPDSPSALASRKVSDYFPASSVSVP